MKTVTAAIIIDGDSVLIARRDQFQNLSGYWEFPGGKVENGESLVECLHRELLEELGVESEIGEVLAKSEYHYDHGSFLFFGIYARLKSNQLTLTVHDRAEWVPIANLLKFRLAPADIFFAQKIQEANPVKLVY